MSVWYPRILFLHLCLRVPTVPAALFLAVSPTICFADSLAVTVMLKPSYVH